MDFRKATTVGVLAAAVVYSGYLIHQAAHPPGTVTSAGQEHHATVGDLPGDVAPNFVLKTPAGKTVELSSLRGHGVWLNFWATWCPNCKVELPIVEQEHKIFGNQVQIIGVDVQESAQTVAKFSAERGLTYPMVLDSQGGVAAAYGVTALPTSVFIGPNGVIRAVYTGAMSNLAMATHYLNAIRHLPVE